MLAQTEIEKYKSLFSIVFVFFVENRLLSSHYVKIHRNIVLLELLATIILAQLLIIGLVLSLCI